MSYIYKVTIYVYISYKKKYIIQYFIENIFLTRGKKGLSQYLNFFFIIFFLFNFFISCYTENSENILSHYNVLFIRQKKPHGISLNPFGTTTPSSSRDKCSVHFYKSMDILYHLVNDMLRTKYMIQISMKLYNSENQFVYFTLFDKFECGIFVQFQLNE